MNYREICQRCFDVFRESIAPRLEYHGDIYESCLDDHCSGGDLWLDLGCGARLLSPWSQHDEKNLTGRYNCMIGMDYDMGSLKRNNSIPGLVRGDISSLPFADDSFDVVTANMVLEHLKEPDVQLAEIRRILKPGGLLIFATPNARGYITTISKLFPDGIKKMLVKAIEDRNEEDVFPAHYRINTDEDIRDHAFHAGFIIVDISHVSSYPKFIVFPPLALIELLFLKALTHPMLKQFRTNIVAVMLKPLPLPEPVRRF